MTSYKTVKRESEKFQDPIIPICGIDHVVFHVKNLEKSRNWWINTFGVRPYQEFAADGDKPTHCFLQFGSCQVGLFESKNTEPQPYAEIDHVCLQSSMDLSQIKKAFKNSGIEIINRPEGLGWPQENKFGLYLHDIDGHVIQILPKGNWPQVDVYSVPNTQ